MKKVCDRCNREISRGLVTTARVNNREYKVCNECAYDIEQFILKAPVLMFGDETINVN